MLYVHVEYELRTAHCKGYETDDIKTCGDLDGRCITFRNDNRPYKRALSFQVLTCNSFLTSHTEVNTLVFLFLRVQEEAQAFYLLFQQTTQLRLASSK